MNKKNKILAGCLALLLALSVGYALFSKTITINGTATAKGSFDITTTCQAGDIYNEFTGLNEYGYDSDECLANNNSVSYKVNLTKPGAKRFFTIVIKNTGTIPATFTVNDIKETEKVCIDTDRDNIIETTDECTNDSDFVSPAQPIGFLTENGEYLSTAEDDLSDFVSDTNIILEPNESFVMIARVEWLEGYDEEKYNNALISMEATTTVNMSQITN